jgi:CRP-like cAMP-binding protein
MSTVVAAPTRPARPVRLTVENSILAALPREEYLRIRADLEPARLRCDESIYEQGEPIRHVYFPRGAVASLLSLLEDGTTVEVGMVGRHGLIGASVILEADKASFWTTVLVGGEAMRMRADALKSWFERSEPLHNLLAGYYRALVTQFCQRAVCNRRHMTLQRLCTWLLMVRDRLGADQIPLTQDLIARCLGSRRATVTDIYNQLQLAGAIRYGRGHTIILDRRLLEELSCECYRVMQEEAHEIFAC